MAELQNLQQRAALEHWSTYGQRGKTPDHRVFPWEWRNEPFKSPVTSLWSAKIRPDQLPILLLGFLPRLAQSHTPLPGLVVIGEDIHSHIFLSLSERKDVAASEDKWFVYADGPDHNGEVRLHMHNSWTGIKAIELVIDAGFDGYGKTGDGARITSIIWESDPDKKLRDADVDTYKKVAREVCNWVLNVRLGPAVWDDGTVRQWDASLGALLHTSVLTRSTTAFRHMMGQPPRPTGDP